MTFHRPEAELFVPDGLPSAFALERTTHLGIGAHPDDLEFMAFHGIIACYESTAQWFGGVTCTDGAGSPRAGPYAATTDAEMRALRRTEQNHAARLGRYGAMVQLGYSSAAVKPPVDAALRDDLLIILRATCPKVIYTHNLADKHATHVAVALATLAAVRALPPSDRPTAMYGCEVWRDLDWLPDAAKVTLDVSGFDALATALNGAFASQVTGGKRYDLGVTGRRRAHATFSNPHLADRASELILAMDLAPLVQDETLDPAAYVAALVDRFRLELQSGLICELFATKQRSADQCPLGF